MLKYLFKKLHYYLCLPVLSNEKIKIYMSHLVVLKLLNDDKNTNFYEYELL